MRMLRTVWASVAVAFVTVGAVAAVPVSAAAEPDRDHAVCQSRACLVVLDWRHDKDGDGVADVDEAVLDTDPGDSRSVPDPSKLLELMSSRKLPSFERHLTELVVLPTVTPDGSALATGLGEFSLRDGDANLLKSIGIVVAETGRNGFDAIFGLRVATSKQAPTYPFGLSPLSASGGIGPDPGPTVEARRFAAWLIATGVSLYSAGSSGTATDLGYNAGKDATGTTLGSDGRPYMNITPSGADKTWDVHYGDGSRDQVSQSYSVGPDGTTTTSVRVESYAPDGSNIGYAYVERHSRTESDGTKVVAVQYSGPTRDADGKITGRQIVNVRMEKKTDGTTNTTVKTTNKDLDGNVLSEKENKYTTGPADEPDCDADCQDEIDNEIGTDYGDPEYIGFDVVTPEDFARMEFRLKQVGQPGPDDGSTGEHEPDSGTFGQCWPNCTGDPLVVLMDPDGVTVFATAEPNFNRWVQPDYDPWLQEMAGLANQKVPATDANPNTDGS